MPFKSTARFLLRNEKPGAITQTLLPVLGGLAGSQAGSRIARRANLGTRKKVIGDIRSFLEEGNYLDPADKTKLRDVLKSLNNPAQFKSDMFATNHMAGLLTAEHILQQRGSIENTAQALEAASGGAGSVLGGLAGTGIAGLRRARYEKRVNRLANGLALGTGAVGVGGYVLRRKMDKKRKTKIANIASSLMTGGIRAMRIPKAIPWAGALKAGEQGSGYLSRSMASGAKFPLGASRTAPGVAGKASAVHNRIGMRNPRMLGTRYELPNPTVPNQAAGAAVRPTIAAGQPAQQDYFDRFMGWLGTDSGRDTVSGLFGGAAGFKATAQGAALGELAMPVGLAAGGGLLAGSMMGGRRD